MRKRKIIRYGAATLFFALCWDAGAARGIGDKSMDQAIVTLEKEFVTRFGEGERARAIQDQSSVALLKVVYSRESSQTLLAPESLRRIA
jgi:hypothetical protein